MSIENSEKESAQVATPQSLSDALAAFQMADKQASVAQNTSLDFLRSQEEAKKARNQASLSSEGAAPDTAQKALTNHQDNQTKVMQADGGKVGVFGFEKDKDGKDIAGGSIIHFDSKSSSGIARTADNPNTYQTFRQTTSGKWYATVGAAQGLFQEWNEAKGKMKDVKPKGHADILQRYKSAALYQIALALVTQEKVQSMNGQKLSRPPVVMVGNYMSDASKRLGGDAPAIKVRAKIIKGFAKQGITGNDLSILNNFMAGMGSKTQYESGALGGGNKTESTSTASIPIYFSQQGLNAVRYYASSSDARPLIKIAQSFATNLGSDCETQKNDIKALITAIEHAERKKPGILGGIIAGLKMAMRMVMGIDPLQENEALHREALKIVLAQRMDGANVSGCQSGKDRKGAVELTVAAYNDYIDKYHEAPPAFGSKEYRALGETIDLQALSESGLTSLTTEDIDAGKLVQAANQEKKDFLDKQFAKHWIDGSAQFVAEANTAGAAGLKNNNMILPAAQRAAVVTAINAEKARINEKDPLTDYDQNRLVVLDALLPEASHELAELNKITAKDVGVMNGQESSGFSVGPVQPSVIAAVTAPATATPAKPAKPAKPATLAIPSPSPSSEKAAPAAAPEQHQSRVATHRP